MLMKKSRGLGKVGHGRQHEGLKIPILRCHICFFRNRRGSQGPLLEILLSVTKRVTREALGREGERVGGGSREIEETKKETKKMRKVT